jgi:LytS/YehU family sensor histidine kinase
LFNTLNVIKLLIRTDANQAREVILNLATFLRKTLNRNDDIMPFTEEVAAVKLYVSIQKVRFGDRLQVDYNISEECNDIKFPAFALQPLVENSMNHGLAEKEGLLSINIEAKINNDFFIVDITDNGIGFPNEVIEAVKCDYMLKEMGIGLTNINHRLKSLYGNRYVFNLENTSDGARVVIKIPSSLS